MFSFYVWRARRELNPDFRLRRPTSYPLDHERTMVSSCVGDAFLGGTLAILHDPFRECNCQVSLLEEILSCYNVTYSIAHIGREQKMTVSRALTIAGSDSGGGAGIQADLKTFTVLGVYGMSALTAITAQNTLGVHGIYNLPLQAIEEQIDAVASDIGVDAVKTGMLSQVPIIETVARKIKEHNIPNLVVDPVMVAKGGAKLLESDSQHALITHLLPLATVVTPNLPEAEVLTGLSIRTVEDMKEAAKKIHAFGPRYVVVKGGHLEGDALDILFDGETFEIFVTDRYETRHTHGTGCTFSAAITAELAKGRSIHAAVETAKDFITCAIRDTLGLGQGHGPTNHWAYGKSKQRV